MPGYIHHIEWHVSDVPKYVDLLVNSYGFAKHAVRRDENEEVQVAVNSGKTVFLVTKRGFKPDDGFPVIECGKSIDTLSNVCLILGDLNGVVNGVVESDGEKSILIKPSFVGDSKVRVAAIKSCVGNIVHTLVDKTDYDGFFLPGFVAWTHPNSIPHKCLTTHMDHVTYVCGPGDSFQILDWYAKIFGMRRFLVNREESEQEGIVIGEEVGMRMKVGEWLSAWLCREAGVQFPKHNDGFADYNEDVDNFKLVLAEPLEDAENSHVQKFLDAHGGPGLQHIGLTTTNIETVVDKMAEDGVKFRRPPPAYYKLEDKVREINASGRDIEMFQRLGLLLDSEADIDDDQDGTENGSKENGHSENGLNGHAENESNGDAQIGLHGYAENGLNGHREIVDQKSLIQIFTQPLFEQDTFFLEVLERHGARGFGAGNITALARSIQLHQEEMAKLKESNLAKS